MVASIKRTLSDPEIKERKVSEIKEKARGSVLAKLAKAKEEVLKHPASGNERRVRKEER